MRFLKRLLEDMRFANYPGFHIAGVRAGWFDVFLVDREKSINTIAPNHLGRDAPSKLLEAVNDLCIVNLDDKSKIKRVSWDDEPGAYIWRLERKDETISIHIYESKTISKDRKQLEREELYRTDLTYDLKENDLVEYKCTGPISSYVAPHRTFILGGHD